MTKTRRLMQRGLLAAIALTVLCLSAYAQPFAPTGGTSLNMSVAPEAAIQITTASTALTTTVGVFGAPFTGLTSFTYKIRTGSAATGTIQVKITTDFSTGGNAPSVANPPTSTDLLTYTCSATATSGTACSTAQTATMTGNGTLVVGFGANAHSTFGGDAGTVSWTIPNDPMYAVGNYSATATFTIAAI